MRMGRICAFLLLTLFGMVLRADAADARTEVLAVMQMQQAAWNRGDLDGFLTGYEKSAEITFVGKSVARGFDGLVQRYRTAYGSRDKMGQLTFSELEFRPLGDEAAFLLGRFQLKRSDAGGGDASGRFTVVFRRTKQGWKIVHDHTSAD
jgi:uncharacterized protein (TIGR02246 family)